MKFRTRNVCRKNDGVGVMQELEDGENVKKVVLKCSVAELMDVEPDRRSRADRDFGKARLSSP